LGLWLNVPLISNAGTMTKFIYKLGLITLFVVILNGVRVNADDCYNTTISGPVAESHTSKYVIVGACCGGLLLVVIALVVVIIVKRRKMCVR